MKLTFYITAVLSLIQLTIAVPSQKSKDLLQPQVQQKEVSFPEKTQFTKSILDNLGNNVIENKQSEYILYYKKGSYAQKNVEILRPMIKTAIRRVKELLRISELPEGFYLFMIDTRDEMERLINWNVKALASGRNDAAIFVYNENIRPYFKHELFHLIAFNIWGEPATRILDEGGAMYSDNECLYYNEPLTTINKYLYENEKWFDLTELVNNFNEKAGENDLIAYLQAGYLFRFLYESYGIDKMRSLWSSGFEYFEKIYGFNLNQLDSRINEQIEKLDYKNVDWEELMEKGCG